MSGVPAFQSNAFQNNAFQVAAATVFAVVPAGSISGGTWSRGKWRKLIGELNEERRAKKKAEDDARIAIVRGIVEKAEAPDRLADKIAKRRDATSAAVEALKAEIERGRISRKALGETAQSLRQAQIASLIAEERAKAEEARRHFEARVAKVVKSLPAPHTDGIKAAIAAQLENRRLQALIERRREEVEDEEAIMAFLASDDD